MCYLHLYLFTVIFHCQLIVHYKGIAFLIVQTKFSDKSFLSWFESGPRKKIGLGDYILYAVHVQPVCQILRTMLPDLCAIGTFT